MKRIPKAVAPQADNAIAAAASAVPIAPPAVRIVKIGTCPSLSGKSTLTYHLGCTDKAEIQIRVVANSGGGFFSPEWIALNTVQKVFARIPSDRPITSFPLQQLFRGKSVNTPSFLMAVLKQEGLVVPMQDKQRRFESVDPAAFMAMVKGLNASAVDLTVDDTKIAGKVEVKKAAAKPKVVAPVKKVAERTNSEVTPEAIQQESEAAISR